MAAWAANTSSSSTARSSNRATWCATRRARPPPRRRRSSARRAWCGSRRAAAGPGGRTRGRPARPSICCDPTFERDPPHQRRPAGAIVDGCSASSGRTPPSRGRTPARCGRCRPRQQVELGRVGAAQRGGALDDRVEDGARVGAGPAEGGQDLAGGRELLADVGEVAGQTPHDVVVPVVPRCDALLVRHAVHLLQAVPRVCSAWTGGAMARTRHARAGGRARRSAATPCGPGAGRAAPGRRPRACARRAPRSGWPRSG